MEINTIRNWTARELVATTDLRGGDIICEHGGLFALSNRRDVSGNFPGASEPVIVFDGIYLGPAFSDDDCAIPAHWRTNEPRRPDGSNHGYWLVQGNHYAMRCRVTDPRPMYYWGEGADPMWRHEPKPGHTPAWVGEYAERRTHSDTMRKLDTLEAAALERWDEYEEAGRALPNVGDVLLFSGTNERYIVDGFKDLDDGATGVLTRRWIKSRGRWAKKSDSWFTTDTLHRFTPAEHPES